MNNLHRLPACMCVCVGILAYLMIPESTVRIHHGMGFELSPRSMSEAEWTLVPGIGIRTAHSLYSGLKLNVCSSSYCEDVELAMLRISGVGPETIRSAYSFINFEVNEVNGKDSP